MLQKNEPPLQIDDLHLLARIDFAIFVELVFQVLHPGKPIQHAPYIDVLFALMTSCAEGRTDRVIVNLPPGFMKSMIISIFYTAWRLGVDPTRKFVCISYGDDLAHKHSIATRTVMLSPVYRAIFPDTVLLKKAENHLSTTKGGYRYATSAGSDITGFRPNEIVVDDPIEPLDGFNENVKLKLRDWISNSVMTRFENTSDSCFILVMHRIAPDDLSYTLSQQEGWFTLALSLIAGKEPPFTDAKTKAEIMRRQPGDILHPDRFSAKDIEKLRREVAPHAFEAQYQQAPKLGGSGMCSAERLHFYTDKPKFEHLVHSWDIGATINGNPSVCTKWGLAKSAEGLDTLFLIDVVRLKLEIPDVRAAIRSQDKLDKPDLIIVDHRGVGLGIQQELINSGMHHVKSVSKGDTNETKIDRFGRALAEFYDGLVRFPKSSPFIDQLLYELVAFPNLKEDDLIDSITQVAAFRERVFWNTRRGLRS